LALHILLTPNKSKVLRDLKTANHKGVALYVLVGIANISGQICTIASMRYLPLSVAALVTLCTPLLVFPLSYWLFKNKEDIMVTVLLGSALTLLGMFLIVMR